jgi:Diguanylate cyclase, GGDEF domain
MNHLKIASRTESQTRKDFVTSSATFCIPGGEQPVAKEDSQKCGRQRGGNFVSDLFRRSAAAGRYGGEEFLIVLPGCRAADLMVSAERLRHSIADCPIKTSAGQLPVTLSLGLASAERGENETLDCETFLRAADEALYAAKAKGRNRAEASPSSRAAGQGGG